MFRGNRDWFTEFENLLRNHLRPFSSRLTEEAKLQFFQRLLREEAIKFVQSVTISTEITLSDVSDNLKKDFTEEDLKDVATYKWDQAKYAPAVETFSVFQKRLMVLAKQTIQYSAAKLIRTLLFVQLPIKIQQNLKNNKKSASAEDIKTF